MFKLGLMLLEYICETSLLWNKSLNSKYNELKNNDCLTIKTNYNYNNIEYKEKQS